MISQLFQSDLQTLVTSLLVFTSLSVFAQNPEKEVENAVEKLRAAMVSADAEALDALVSKDVSYGHSSGKIEDKKAFVEALTNGTSDFLEIELKDQSVKVTGDVALVRHQLLARTHDKGKDPASVKIGVLLVWVKEGGSWKLLGRQAFK